MNDIRPTAEQRREYEALKARLDVTFESHPSPAIGALSSFFARYDELQAAAEEERAEIEDLERLLNDDPDGIG
jgi:hypothetical protein